MFVPQRWGGTCRASILLGFAELSIAACAILRPLPPQQSGEGEWAKRREAVGKRAEDVLEGALRRPATFAQLDALSQGTGDSAACVYEGTGPPPLTLVTAASGLPPTYLAGLHVNRLRELRFGGYEYCEYSVAGCSGEEIAWSKIRAIQTLHRRGRKVVAWMDADALVMKPALFENVVQDAFRAGRDVAFTRDHPNLTRDTVEGPLNSGVFVSRSSSWSERFWADVWDSHNVSDPLSGLLWEQFALVSYRRTRQKEFDEHVAILPWQAMNSYIPALWLQRLDAEVQFVVHATWLLDLMLKVKARRANTTAKTKWEMLVEEFMQPGCLCCCLDHAG